jgi:ribosome-associated toxin RatA of RatAB toxin-antitoxin module
VQQAQAKEAVTMPDYEQTSTIEAEPDVLFDYLAELQHLPEYLPIINDAEPTGTDEVDVEADIAGDVQRSHGWVHVDGLERRMEWGVADGPYHGWLQVDPDEMGHSVVTLHVHQEHDSDADDELAEALDNIRRLVAAGAA